MNLGKKTLNPQRKFVELYAFETHFAANCHHIPVLILDSLDRDIIRAHNISGVPPERVQRKTIVDALLSTPKGVNT